MHPSRSIARTVLALIAGAAPLAACSAAPDPSGAIPTAKPSASVTVGQSSRSPSIEPVASELVAAESSESSSEPPTEEPSDEPTPAGPVNPTAKPVPPAPTDCGNGDIAVFRDEVPEDLHFGGARIEFTTAGIATRDGSHLADDAIPGGIGLTPDEIAVRVDPGTHIILRASGTSLTNLAAGSVAWSSVEFEGGLASSAERPAGVSWRFGAGGTISVTAPSEPGDYMISFVVDWFTHCLRGDGVAYGRIKVNG